MTSEPISGLPAGTPADANLFAQSTGAAGQTQKITELQLFKYVASKSVNNVIYVNNVNGVDAVGNGTVLQPYATISYAISQIASHAALTRINAFGNFIETNLSFPRNLIIDLNQGTLSVTNPVTLDSSWLGNPGDIFVMNSSNIDFAGGFTPNFSSSPLAILYIENFITTSSTAWTIQGNSTSGSTIAVFQDVFGLSGAPSITVLDCYGGVVGCSPAGLTIIDNGTGSDYNFTIQNNTIIGDYTVQSTNSRTMNVNSSGNIVSGNTLIKSTSSGQASVIQTSQVNLGTVTIDGVNSLLNTDTTSPIPLLTNGATTSNITYRDLADTITAGFAPSSYTPTDPQVKGHLEGIDNELNIGTGRVAFGIFGGGIFGDSTFTFDISTKRLTVKDVNALSATIGTPFSTGTPLTIIAGNDFASPLPAPGSGIQIRGDAADVGIDFLINDDSHTSSLTFSTQDLGLYGLIVGSPTGIAAAEPQVALGIYGSATAFGASGTYSTVPLFTDDIDSYLVGSVLNICPTKASHVVIGKPTGIGGAPNSSAILDITSTTQGLGLSNMTTAEMNAIASPKSGLQIFNTTTSQFMGYNGTAWVILG